MDINSINSLQIHSKSLIEQKRSEIAETIADGQMGLDQYKFMSGWRKGLADAVTLIDGARKDLVGGGNV